MMNQTIPRPVLVALFLVADVLLLAVGWFGLVAPQQHHAASAARGIAITEKQIAAERSFSRPATSAPTPAEPTQPAIHTSLLYRITKAMPDTADQPDLLLELDQVARAAGVVVLSVAPGTPTTGDGFSVFPISLSAEGDFYSLTDLLYRLRGLVAVHHGSLDATGRLFSVESVSLTPTGTGKQLTAEITVDAFVYGTAFAATAPGSTTPSSTDTTSTSTSTTTTGATTTGTSG